MRTRSSRWQRLRRRLARATRALARLIEGPSPTYYYSYTYLDAYGESPQTGTGVRDTGAPGLQVTIPLTKGATGYRLYRSHDVGFW